MKQGYLKSMLYRVTFPRNELLELELSHSNDVDKSR